VSDSDSFIREVTEEVRQERMLKLWKRFGPYVIGGLVLLVAASAAWSWRQSAERQTALETGAAFLAADPGDVAAAEALVTETEGKASAIAHLRLAMAEAAAGDPEVAADIFREVAETPDLAPAYADLAALHAVRIDAPRMTPEAVQAALDPLIAPGAPYRLLALELRAATLANAGAASEALADLDTILTDPEATPGLRARAAELRSALEAGTGGSAG